MAGDPLEVGLLALLDQGRSVADQLAGVAPARAALSALGDDPDALATTLLLRVDAAETAWSERQRALGAADLAHARARTAVVRATAWLTRLRRVLAVAALGADGQPRGVAVRAIRAAMPPRIVSVQTARAAASSFLAVARPADADLTTVTGWAGLVAATTEHAASLDAIDAAVRAADLDAAHTSLARKNATTALRSHLRDIRARWRAAVTLDPGVPALDLRIGAAAVASRTRAPKPQAQPTPPPPPEEPPPSAEEPGCLPKW